MLDMFEDIDLLIDKGLQMLAFHLIQGDDLDGHSLLYDSPLLTCVCVDCGVDLREVALADDVRVVVGVVLYAFGSLHSGSSIGRRHTLVDAWILLRYLEIIINRIILL